MHTYWERKAWKTWISVIGVVFRVCPEIFEIPRFVVLRNLDASGWNVVSGKLGKVKSKN